MNKAVFNRLMRFIHPYRRYLLVSLAFATGNVALTLYAPILVGRAIDLIIGPGSVDFPGIARIVAVLLGTILLAAVFQIGRAHV